MLRRRGGAALALYGHALTLALLLLFACSFVLHAARGARDDSQEQMVHGGQAVAAFGYLHTLRL